MTKTLAVIGAGVKAIAVAAKAAELRAMGVPAPEVMAIERTAVAANWQAAGGWTDGQHRLGTGPEKDIGFPYQSALVARRNAELDERMMRHSWQSYLVSSGQFAEWIDRGRPAPTHKRWSQYLNWVASNIGMQVRTGDVTEIGLQDTDDATRWELGTREGVVHADALMITGPGQAERSLLPGNPRVLSIAQFWHRAAQNELISADRVAVIGGGETAGTMLDELFRHRPLVESARPLLGNRGKDRGKVALHEPVALAQRTAVRLREGLCRIRPPRHPAIHVR